MRRPPTNVCLCLGALTTVAVLSCLLLERSVHVQAPEGNPPVGPLQGPISVVAFDLPKREVARELPSGALHSYRLQLEAGQLIQLSVEQVGVDLTLEVLDSRGGFLYAVDSPNEAKGVEEVVLVGPAGGGIFCILIDGRGTEGSYVLRVEALREATEEDRTRSWAATIYYRAEGDLAEGTNEDARIGFEEALRLWEGLADWPNAQRAAFGLGRTDKPRATMHYRHALILAKRASDKEREAATLIQLGEALRSSGDPKGAESHLKTALDLARELTHKTLEASALGYLGDFSLERRELWLALTRYRESLRLWTLIHREDEQARALVRLLRLA